MRMSVGRFGRFLGQARNSKVLFPYATLVETPPGAKIVVLSPHPDDDILGCGGVLAKHANIGASIASVYMTDGRKGDPSFSSEDELVKERQKEARSACDVIGIRQLEFLGARDQELRATTKIVKQLEQVLAKCNPDLVYVPFFLDNHLDHLETNRVLVQAAGAVNSQTKVAMYETWTPLVCPNLLVNTTEVMDLKERAIRCHKTQMKVINFMTAFGGLNAYRAAFAGINGYAEAFWCLPLQGYVKTFREFV
jgi:LmbE family N-acetylglucosaminyl deacetylase